ncbi:MAG: hypothetical protein ACI9OI_002388 [Chitinophagales bacterium]
MTYNYRVYGLNIALSQPLSQLRPIEHSDFDVFIDISNLNVPSICRDAGGTNCSTKQQFEDSDNSDGITVLHSADWICIAYPRSQHEILRFYISKDGSRVVSEKPATIPFSDIESFILGPILGCVLRLRQRICIHASVMEYNGKAFAFVGNKGAGKSTTAGALLQAGARLVSDDIAVLNAGDASDTTVYPGYPGVRLFPNTLSVFGLNENDYRQVVSSSNKRYVPLIDSDHASINTPGWRFNSTPCKLMSIYALAARQPDLRRTKIHNLTKKEALISLAPHGYGRRILNKQQRAEEFVFLAKLSRRIQIKSVHRPNKLELLAEIAEDILADVNKLI